VSVDAFALDLDLDVEEVADRLLLDAIHHGVEQVESLALVFDERITLSVGTKADAFLQVVHLVEVLTPLAVENGEHDLTLELTRRLGAQFGLPLGVRLVGLRLDLRAKELRVERIAGP